MDAYRRLKLLVPIVQVLACIAVRLLRTLLSTDLRLYDSFYIPAVQMVERLNYPVMAFWFSVVYVLGWLLRPLAQPSSGWALTLWMLVAALLLLASVGLFWYLAVREFELRRQGRSLLHFSGRFRPVLALVVLFCFAIGALVLLYWDASSEIPMMLVNRREIGWVLTVLTEVLWLLWALVLLRMFAVDLRVLLRSRAA